MHPAILEQLRPITQEEHEILCGQDVDRSRYNEDGGSIVSSRRLLEQGKLIAIRPHTRFVHFPKHTHDYVEVVYMCSGQTTHIVNGETIILREGELLFLSQNARQEILPAGENDLAVNFIVLPHFFDKTLVMLGEEETPLRRFVIDCLCGGTGSGYLHFRVADVLPIQNLLENLLFTLITDIPNKRNINQTTMGLLFLQLLNYTDRLSWESKEEAMLAAVMRDIEENYQDGNLTRLADKMHYDLSWLSREIKRKTGMSYTELLQQKRLSQAAFLLRTTKRPVAEIACSVGYENVSYFYRIFTRYYDRTPRAYRLG